MVGYADRQVLALLKPALDATYGWAPDDYAAMATAFQIAIAVSLLGAGWFLDRAGLRWGFAAGMAGWSLAAMLHAAARTVPQFIAARAALGVCESVGTPAGMKALASLFEARERPMAIGIANAAPNVAAMLTPLAVTALYAALGWQATVLILGAGGFVCVGLWLALPLRGLPAAAPAAPGLAGSSILRDRAAWGLGAAKLLTDQAWWFMLFWLPDFFARRHGLDIRHLGPPLAAIYVGAGLGSLAGGALPGALARIGVARPRARAAAMAVFAVAVLPVAVLADVDAVWGAVALAALALAGHQGFATNVFAIAADLFPATRIGSVIGFAAFWGNVGGAASVFAAGQLLKGGGGLAPMFVGCAAGYPLAWAVLRLIARQQRPADSGGTP